MNLFEDSDETYNRYHNNYTTEQDPLRTEDNDEDHDDPEEATNLFETNEATHQATTRTTTRPTKTNLKQAQHALRDHVIYGDSIQEKAPNTCRIYFQNVYGVSPAEDWIDMQDYFVQMQKRQVDVFGFAETNVAWNPKLTNQVYQHGRGLFEHFKQVNSSSDDPTTGFRQPGGTFMATTGKFVGRVSQTDTDTYGLG